MDTVEIFSKTVQEQWRALQRGFHLHLQEHDRYIAKIKFIQAIESGTMSAMCYKNIYCGTTGGLDMTWKPVS